MTEKDVEKKTSRVRDIAPELPGELLSNVENLASRLGITLDNLTVLAYQVLCDIMEDPLREGVIAHAIKGEDGTPDWDTATVLFDISSREPSMIN